MLPIISVVIPLYNKAPYIKRAINSILTQTYSDLELIVVDDGSTDESSCIVSQCTDRRLRLITQPNSGVSAARNRGIAESHGKWIAFLDADDEWMPKFLERAIEFVKTHPFLVIIFTNVIGFVDKTVWLDCSFSQPRVLDNFFAFLVQNRGRGITSSSVMVQKQALETLGGFPIGVNRGEDVDIWIRLAMKSKVGFIPEVLTVYHNEVAGSGAMFPEPPFPEGVKTLRRLREGNEIPHNFARSSLMFENLLLLQYAKELTDYGNWAGAFRVLYGECRIRNCPKEDFVKIQCRLLFKGFLKKILRGKSNRGNYAAC